MSNIYTTNSRKFKQQRVWRRIFLFQERALSGPKARTTDVQTRTKMGACSLGALLLFSIPKPRDCKVLCASIMSNAFLSWMSDGCLAYPILEGGATRSKHTLEHVNLVHPDKPRSICLAKCPSANSKLSYFVSRASVT